MAKKPEHDPKHASNETAKDVGHKGKHRADEWAGGSVGNTDPSRRGRGTTVYDDGR